MKATRLLRKPLASRYANGVWAYSSPSQRLAKLIKVTTDTATCWEKGRNVPMLQHYPGIIRFLGYNPFALDDTQSVGKIKQYRLEQSLSKKAFARLIGIDPATITRMEEG